MPLLLTVTSTIHVAVFILLNIYSKLKVHGSFVMSQKFYSILRRFQCIADTRSSTYQLWQTFFINVELYFLVRCHNTYSKSYESWNYMNIPRNLIWSDERINDRWHKRISVIFIINSIFWISKMNLSVIYSFLKDKIFCLNTKFAAT